MQNFRMIMNYSGPHFTNEALKSRELLRKLSGHAVSDVVKTQTHTFSLKSHPFHYILLLPNDLYVLFQVLGVGKGFKVTRRRVGSYALRFSQQWLSTISKKADKNNCQGKGL